MIRFEDSSNLLFVGMLMYWATLAKSIDQYCLDVLLVWERDKIRRIFRMRRGFPVETLDKIDRLITHTGACKVDR